MVDRRALAYVDTSGNLPEKEFRAQVNDVLGRLARLIAANTTADGALSNRVTELEDAPPGLALTSNAPANVTGAALVLAAWTGETGGTMDVVARRLRVRRIR